MKNISFWRIIVNILFYIFYVLVISVVVSFAIPFLQTIFDKAIFDPSNFIFDTIQYIIFLLVLIISFIFRKSFYLPIYKAEKVEETFKESKTSKDKKYFSFDDETVNNSSGLDIKVGREIK